MKDGTAKLIAGLSAIATCAVLLLGPLFVYSAYSGTPWDKPLPDKNFGFQLILIGGFAGLVAAPVVHYYLLCIRFGLDDEAFESSWHVSPKKLEARGISKRSLVLRLAIGAALLCVALSIIYSPRLR